MTSTSKDFSTTSTPDKTHTAVLDGTLTLADIREHLSGQGGHR